MKIIIIITILGLVMIASCNNQKEQNKDMQQQVGHVQSDTIDKSKKEPEKFAGVQFAAAIDTACGMSINSGVADTLLLDGKVYGFCSASCKEEFAKELVAQNKR